MQGVVRQAKPVWANALKLSRARFVASRYHAQQWRYASIGPAGGPAPTPGQVGFEEAAREAPPKTEKVQWGPTLLKMFESSLTTFVSVAVLG